MLRLPNWTHRLSALMLARAQVPFAWGSNDCASFAADVAVAVYGVDALAELRGERGGPKAARRQERAGGGIPAALQRAGLQEIAPAFAQRGDLLWLAQGHQRGLAVCWGEHAAAPGPVGLVFTPSARGVKAWRL